MADVVYFFSPTAEHGWMSNWSAHPVRMNEREFRTAEHAFAHAKAELMGDAETARLVTRAASCAAAKALGRRVAPWDEALWVREREGVMLRVLRAKLRSNPDLEAMLRATGDRAIAEASPHDRIWGIGLRRENAERGEKWRGKNLLGKAWERAREELFKLPVY